MCVCVRNIWSMDIDAQALEEFFSNGLLLDECAYVVIQHLVCVLCVAWYIVCACIGCVLA